MPGWPNSNRARTLGPPNATSEVAVMGVLDAELDSEEDAVFGTTEVVL